MPRKGLLAWAALGHETGGHDILHADTGLRGDLAREVADALRKARRLKKFWARYWSSRIDETASDVLGILNMGPAAGIGLIGYFRGIRSALGGESKLGNIGDASDPHPADILRGYLAASTVRMLSFDNAKAWADILTSEADKDISQIEIEGTVVTRWEAAAAAQIVADRLMHARVQSLEYHSLGEIQDWRNRDEGIVAELSSALVSSEPLPSAYPAGAYAAHAVSACVVSAVSGKAVIKTTFDRMLSMLKTMHDGNPSWGPLYVLRPGNLVRHIIYRRTS